MFIYQGQKAFYLWNKINPEIDQKLIEPYYQSLSDENCITGSLSSGTTVQNIIK